MNNLREKIINSTKLDKSERIGSVKVYSTIIDSAIIEYFNGLGDALPSFVHIIFKVNKNKISDFDTRTADNSDMDIISTLGRDNKIYKYIFTLLKTVTNINIFKCEDYISDKDTSKVEYFSDYLELNLYIRTEIIRDSI